MASPEPSPSYVPGPIWPPDWSQFIPDAIGAIATGALVGLVFWWLEVTAGNRRARREAESNWRARRGVVGLGMDSMLYTWFPQDPARQFPGQWSSFLAVVDPRVVIWSEAAPKNRELALARSLVLDLPLLDRLLQDLESIVLVDLIALDVLQGTLVTDQDVDFFLTRFISESAEDGLPTNIPAHLDPRLEENYEVVMDPEAIGTTATLFKSTLRRAESNWTELWERVGS